MGLDFEFKWEYKLFDPIISKRMWVIETRKIRGK